MEGPATCECEVCATGKAKRQVSVRAHFTTQRAGAQFSFDLHPGPVAGFGGEKYFALFTCMTTGMRFYYALTNKTKKLVQYGIKLINLASDGEKALLTKELVKFIEGLGIRVFQSAPSTPTQNGHAERSGAVVKERARLMNLDSRIPEELWTETYRTALEKPTRTMVDPYEGPQPLYGHIKRVQPSINHLRVFGCVAYPMAITALEHVKSHKTQSPLEQRAHIGYLVGYRSTHQYVVWIPSIRQTKLMVSANVQFDESTMYDPKSEEDAEAVQVYTYDVLRQMVAIDVPDDEDIEEAGCAVTQ
ncbi:uncharacterized protein HRG_07361 [Hirsutella rhossiliensis]|uniref:Integrase catalytic domain-containing protein n=1 Tax=Hirsutella rhossiliensis TaxID=111463 RepID=A0A9P8MSQ4_9HYPO|nr:uncharacterized protein HRG_07361 [Hirsutella rhossiliensis]KAH0961283.1 hypothetical protein HRG_07361 [Hirsutella rhossiliensis]